MNPRDMRAPLSATDLKAIYTKELTCLICGCNQWRPTVRLLYNPLAGPTGGLIPQDGVITCAHCGTVMGTTPEELQKAQQEALAAQAQAQAQAQVQEQTPPISAPPVNEKKPHLTVVK